MAGPRRTGGISHDGASAEQVFCALTGATKAATARQGDAVLNGCNIEVKKASAQTINQVRAVKYIPLVVFHEPTSTWYVVAAHVVVCLVSSKARGQHTENPFESATLNVFALGKYKVAAPEDLKQATLQAIADAERYPEMKAAMAAVLADSRALAAKSAADVTALIARLQIVP
ncbi:MAG: hypothetical protein M3Y87_22035 [Myxococcota bacterium]|nr:hypothetical protein [Myxococcota bacterium]